MHKGLIIELYVWKSVASAEKCQTVNKNASGLIENAIYR